MSDNDLENVENFYNRLSDFLLLAFLHSRKHDHIGIIGAAPNMTCGIYDQNSSILFTPRFLTADIKRDMQYKNDKAIVQLKMINKSLVPRIEAVGVLHDEQDIEDLLEKIKVNQESSCDGEDEDEEECGDEEESMMSLEAFDDFVSNDPTDNAEVFDVDWLKDRENIIDKTYMDIDDLKAMPGVIIMKLFGSIYLVAPMSLTKDIDKVDEMLEISERALRMDKVLMMIEHAYYMAEYASNLYFKKHNFKMNEIELQIRCNEIFMDGKTVYDECVDEVRKVQCPFINRESQCHIGVVTRKMIKDSISKNVF